MPKKTLFGLITLAIFFMMPNVYAKEYIVLNTPKAFKDSPSGSRITSIGDGGVLPTLSKVVVVEKTNKSGYGCRSPWYKVTYQDVTGYICSSDQAVIEESDVNLEADFEKEMLAKGFNESYLSALKNLHEKHPNWIFNALKTNLDYNEAIKNETIGEISLVNGSDESLRKKDDNGNFIESVKEKGWYQASSSAVGYYMDPRNFLNDTGVYQFMTHSYDGSNQNANTVAAVVKGTFMETRKPGGGYSNYASLINAVGKASNVNPNVLAAMIVQEQGSKGTSSLISGTVSGYKGYYNFFNVNAYETPSHNKITNGLIYAKNHGWNSVYNSIKGGADFYYRDYVSKKQNTYYLKKFNVNNGLSSVATHQYMTNVQGAAGEGTLVRKAFGSDSSSAVTFEIPVYNSMPSSICPLP